MPAVRRDGKRKILPRMRHEKARSTGRRLDVQLRREEHGQILFGVRQARARRRVDLRVRHEKQRQILLQLRQALRRLR